MFKCYYLLQCLRLGTGESSAANGITAVMWMSIRVTHFKCAWFISAGSPFPAGQCFTETHKVIVKVNLFMNFLNKMPWSHIRPSWKEKQKGISFCKKISFKRPKGNAGQASIMIPSKTRTLMFTVAFRGCLLHTTILQKQRQIYSIKLPLGRKINQNAIKWNKLPILLMWLQVLWFSFRLLGTV